ncbi:MAG TPA: hypothetical protein DIU00_22525, partial [Phycisphaerales bacterium]|nr:hypothetical protein [Phycisphaerales bacterium]
MINHFLNHFWFLIPISAFAIRHNEIEADLRQCLSAMAPVILKSDNIAVSHRHAGIKTIFKIETVASLQ